jgi:hypothetical protein
MEPVEKGFDSSFPHPAAIISNIIINLFMNPLSNPIWYKKTQPSFRLGPALFIQPPFPRRNIFINRYSGFPLKGYRCGAAADFHSLPLFILIIFNPVMNVSSFYGATKLILLN